MEDASFSAEIPQIACLLRIKGTLEKQYTYEECPVHVITLQSDATISLTLFHREYIPLRTG